jgi:flavin-dependent dehydrogenase
MTTSQTSQRRDHDVVVVGARVAGAATAMLLARAGHDVLLLDKANLPHDTLSTHSLVRGGVVQLARWDLLDQVLASGAPAIRSVWFHEHGPGAGAPVRRVVKERAGVDLMLAPRRHVLDAILADAAVGAGATLRTGSTVTGVRRDAHGRVIGVVGRDRDGTPFTAGARMVVGADGVHSRMAHHLGAGVLEEHAVTGPCFYTYVGGVPWDGFEFHVADGAFAGVFPTHDDQACVWLFPSRLLASPIVHAGTHRSTAWLQALRDAAPELAERVAGGTSDRFVRGAVGLPNRVRRAHGPGWALVGDAGYHRDPITGHGMTDAFRDAELLADAVDHALRGLVREQRALAAYQEGRDRAIREVFDLTRQLGALPPRPQFVDLQMRLSRALEAEAEHLASRPVRTRAALALC